MSNKRDTDRAFRQRTLYAAMSAIGFVNGEASATYANYDGFGPTLIFPYYTMRDPNHGGLVSAHEFIRGKLLEEQAQVRRVVYPPPYPAVKVKYLSGPRATPNTDEVRDFNLFLSPADVWTGAVESAQGLESVVRHVSPGVLARAALDSLAALADRPQAVVAGIGTDWVIHLHPGLLAGEARIREGYVEVVDMGSSRHLGQYPQDLRQIALFNFMARDQHDREEWLRSIGDSAAVIMDPSEGPQDGYFHPENILGRPRGPRAVDQHLVRGSRSRNRGAKRG